MQVINLKDLIIKPENYNESFTKTFPDTITETLQQQESKNKGIEKCKKKIKIVVRTFKIKFSNC